MNDKELLEKIGLTEAEADVRGAIYENDEWDESSLEKPQCGKPSAADNENSVYTNDKYPA